MPAPRFRSASAAHGCLTISCSAAGRSPVRCNARFGGATNDHCLEPSAFATTMNHGVAVGTNDREVLEASPLSSPISVGFARPV